MGGTNWDWSQQPASLGLACAAAAVGLLISYLMRNQCATHPWADAFQYRHLCYNDIQPLFHARGVDRGLVPYTDVTVEYPVLIGTFMYGAGRILAFLTHVGLAAGYNDPSYFQITALLLWPFSFAVTLLLRRRVTAGRLMLWAIGTPTIFYTFLNWDILAVAALVWGLVEVEKRRWGWAGFALALGASAKLFPAFALPGAFLAAWAARDRRGATRLVNGFGLGVLGANVPWMIASFSGWMGVWKFHADRWPDLGTTWYWFGALGNTVHPSAWWTPPGGGWRAVVGVVGLAAFGLVSLLILWVGWRRRDEPGGYPVVPTGLAIIASFMVLSKVLSPQYALWVMPLIVMVDIPWRQVLAYLASDAVLFVSGWWWYTKPDPFLPPAPLAEKIFVLAVFARSMALIVIAVQATRRGRRLEPAAPDAGARPSRKHFFAASQNGPDSVGTLPYSGQQMDVEPNRG
ncbi:MAG: putative integral rane protein [Actinobacteria bacterium]|nr:putative integral rane protein [Actinomycetota bacterium]